MQKIASFIMATIMLISIVSLGIFSVSAEYSTEAYSKTYYRGVNLSGAESAGHILPGVEGTDYTFGEEKIFAYLERKGFDIARVPVLWERLQHTLSGPLDTVYINGLKRNAQWAANHNMKIVIDVHNYGKYNGEFIGVEGSSVTVEDYADLWSKLSTEFKDNKGVYAYDIMNEPIFDGYKDWHKASQAAVSAIRANGDDTLIYVEGNFWGHCEHWTDINGEEPWISDPMDNTSYSAHCYFDTDTSGSYKLSFDEQLKETPDLLEIGTNRVREFGEWCKKYNLKGYIGEYGVPYRDDSKTGEYENNTRWSNVIDNFLDTLDYYKMDATAWAAGHWWDKINILNIYPANPNMNPLVDDSVHMDTFTNHLSNKEDYSPLQFGDNRVFESEYSVITGTGSRVNNSSLSNGQHVSLSVNSSLDFCRINSLNGGDTLIKISYMARNGASITISVDNKIVKEVSFESVGKYTDYETIITLPTGKSSIQINTTSQSGAIFIDEITLTSLKTNQLAFTSPIDGDYIKLHYAADKPYSDIEICVNGEVKTTANIPSTYGKKSTLTIPLNIKANDKVELFKGYPSDETAFLSCITVLKSTLINSDGKTILDTPKSLDCFSSSVIKRSTADFNNTEDEIWGYKGYDGNMKNWNVQKLLRDNSSTDRYYRTSFTETGTYGTMKSAHFNLPLGQGSMWDLSNFKYVTMDIRSNTNVAVRLYQNGPTARETSSGPTIPNTNGKWETATIPIEDFLSSWLYNDFTRNSSRVNYIIFYPSFTEGGNADRYFDVDNISFDWTNSKVGITRIDFTDSTGASINSKGLSAGRVKATITVSNTKDIDAGNEVANVLAIFALYDKTTGDLSEVKASSKSIESNKTVSIYDTITVPDNAYDRYELKIHLWDSITLTPITESYIFY